ncbi:stalk domain-containing protein [Paenibacillus sp. GCM10023248]|uniref:stalk domain-containing protein n=1 Tax=Bacillales TaxID=1385 RepID=UPI0023796E77|nr:MULTISPECIES: DUF4163 domain-containing protein [Bacillales]MDD9271423.1 stalk domain-containing protein [Paenibacillus sp. MAHUQ-63]MDR6884362.1 hypothetical protein [Bacillus sp. 3255]
MNKKMFTIKVALAAALLAGFSGSALLPQTSVRAETYSADQEVQLAPLRIQIGDQLLDVPGGKTKEGDTYVGLAFLSKQLGLTTSWDSATKTVTVSSPHKTMSMHNQSTEYALNDHKFYAPLPPVIIEGTTYLPLRLLLEQMGYKIGYIDQSHIVTIAPIQENELKLTNKSDSLTKSDNRRITLQYPQIEGWANTAASDKINAFLQAEADKYKAAAIQQLNDLSEVIGSTEPDFPNTFDVNYKITYNQDHKLSLYFIVYTFSGGAHGFYAWDSHTFDLDTGNELTLQQVASNNPQYKSIINEEIKKQLKEHDYELIEPFESIRNDQGFYLKDDTVVVYFGLYEYAPYALGILEFPVPLSAFK